MDKLLNKGLNSILETFLLKKKDLTDPFLALLDSAGNISAKSLNS
jgi:hypothetical protein